MKLTDIIAQLQTVYPKYADHFSNLVTVSSLTRTGTTARAVCATAHGLASNDYAVIRGAYLPNTITITQAAGVATAVTALPHDLTYEEGATVLISGAAQAGYNGTMTLLSVPDRNTFTFTVAAATVSPATGTPVLNENKATGYNGRVKVTVVDTTTFTYTVDGSIPAAPTGTIKALLSMRISGAITLDWLGRLYSEQAPEKLWMWVVPGEARGSHNRNIQSDATYRYAAGQNFFQEMIQAVKIVVIAPTTTELAARAAVDNNETVRKYIFKSVLGAKFSSELDNAGDQYGLTYQGDRVSDYVGAYYAHEYDFEMVSQIDGNDICLEDDSVAWRNFTANMLNVDTGDVIKQVAGRLP